MISLPLPFETFSSTATLLNSPVVLGPLLWWKVMNFLGLGIVVVCYFQELTWKSWRLQAIYYRVVHKGKNHWFAGGGQINDMLAREDAVLFRSFKQLPPLFLIPLRIFWADTRPCKAVPQPSLVFCFRKCKKARTPSGLLRYGATRWSQSQDLVYSLIWCKPWLYVSVSGGQGPLAQRPLREASRRPVLKQTHKKRLFTRSNNLEPGTPGPPCLTPSLMKM